MESHKSRWNLGRMCTLLNVSRSGFYAWRKRGLSKRAVSSEDLTEEIKRIYDEGRGEYGSPTIYHVLREKGVRSGFGQRFIEGLRRRQALARIRKLHRIF
jgi:hypothetical protein